MNIHKTLIGNKSSPLEKEWSILLKREARFLEKQKEKKTSAINQKLGEVIPAKLQDTLNLGFFKAFQLVFEKGTGVIERTYPKDKREYTQKINAYAVELKESRKNLKAFSKQAGASKRKNLMVSGVEGIGTGLFGIGIPDIPLFTGLILKSLYEIAVSYGFPYDSEEEEIFLLNVIKTSLSYGAELTAGDQKINRWIEKREAFDSEKTEAVRQAAERLSEELLYMKFVQGLPIVGIAGGISDCVYLKRITDYGELKYRRRFLLDKIKNHPVDRGVK